MYVPWIIAICEPSRNNITIIIIITLIITIITTEQGIFGNLQQATPLGTANILRKVLSV